MKPHGIDTLTFERHTSGERVAKKMGLTDVEMWKCVKYWVHFAVNLDKRNGRWTASYQLDPMMTGGKAKTVHVDIGAMPTILSPDQPGPMPAYDSKEAAVSACNITYSSLKGRFGL